MNNCAVVIPVYKESLDAEEFFSVNYSLRQLIGHDIHWVAPKSLDMSYYIEKFQAKNLQRFEDGFFKNIQGYNRLLVSVNFYQQFRDYEFMLVYQPDAIILKPELKFWLDKPYDYIGAPWPSGYSLDINISKFSKAEAIKCTAFVGNGGLSLRRINACVALISEFKDVSDTWYNMGHAEDLFFSLLGSTLSESFKIPNMAISARFSHDIDPIYLQKIISYELPFGVHAWSKYEKKYWQNIFKNKLKIDI